MQTIIAKIGDPSKQLQVTVVDTILVSEEVHVTLPSGKGGTINTGTTAIAITAYIVEDVNKKLHTISPKDIVRRLK